MRKTSYEQPLNERIRAFLRLEFLFKQADYSLNGTSAWNSRAALETIIEIHDLVSRSDLKTEILKELERHTQSLTLLFENPQVDHKRLDHVLLALDSFSNKLFSDNLPFGHALKHNEFITSIRQRTTVPGGTSEMDLPGYHFWLQKSSDERIAILTKWISGFDTMRKAIELILQLIRDSAVPRWELAENGFFQRNLDPANPCQILRISLPAEQDCYPEISGGKHRFTVRFLRQESDEARPKQINQDIEFEMSCCMI